MVVLWAVLFYAVPVRADEQWILTTADFKSEKVTIRAIDDGALTFGVPYKLMLKIARCESALNPRASNGTYLGLYQFAPRTFWSMFMARTSTGRMPRD